MIKLANGCWCSDIKVTPANWNKAGASIKKDWKVYYRFHDPEYENEFPEGYYVGKKNMNSYKTLAERREVTKFVMDEIKRMLLEMNYNPITGFIIEIDTDCTPDYELPPNTPLIAALTYSQKNVNVEPNTRKDIKSVLKYFTVAAKELRLNEKPINEIERRHIKLILKKVGENKKEKWTASNQKFYIGNLQIVFKYLFKEIEILKFNPMNGIDQPYYEPPKKEVLSQQQRIDVDDYLRKNNYTFWRFMQIFFHSGARETEMMRLKFEDVDLTKQEVKYLVKKGKHDKIVTRVIKDQVLHLWQEVMLHCGPSQYVFSEGLIPGPIKISPSQINRRWKRWVKDNKDLNISVDFYPLKHLNTTETRKKLGAELAAQHNQHSKEIMTKHYDVAIEEDEKEILKKMDNSFS